MRASRTRVSGKFGLVLIGLGAAAMLLGAQASQAAPRPQEATKGHPAPAKKAAIVVFPLSGSPAPGKQWQRPKGVPKVPPLAAEEKLKILQGVQGIPAVSAPTPFLTLYPGHLYDPAGSLELDWPKWDRLGIAYYTPTGPQADGTNEALAKDEQVHLTFKADAGNVYLVDFIVVIEVPTTSTGERDFEVTVSGAPPADQKAFSGGNHLVALIYSQAGGYYNVQLGLKPREGNSAYPRWGDWYFLVAEVTKFVPAS